MNQCFHPVTHGFEDMYCYMAVSLWVDRYVSYSSAQSHVVSIYPNHAITEAQNGKSWKGHPNII